MQSLGTTPARRPASALALAGALAAVFAPPAAALDPTRTIQQLSHAWYQDQLPQNTILAIAQRYDGSMWFATYNGLARHSGGEFSVIDPRNTGTLASSAFTALLEDRGGTLWIATLNGGLYRIAREASRVERVELPAPIESVFALAEDARGAIWLGTNAGVVRLDAGGARVYATDEGIPRVPIRTMAADADGGIWVAMDGAGVAHFRDGVPELLDEADGLPDVGVFAVEVDRAGTVWAGTQAGLARYRDGRFVREPAAAAIDGKRVYTLLGDRDGNLWATADGEGLCRLNAAGFECDREVEGLTHDVVRSMLEDREGNLWIGATSSGVHRISDSKLATTTGALDTNSVRALAEARDGTLWAGTDGAGLARIERGALRAYEHNDRIASAFIRALHPDEHGRLWVGTIVGLDRVAADGTVASFDKSDGLPGAIVFALADDGSGGRWIGTSGGLARIGADDRVVALAAAGPHDIRALHQDRRGTLWIGQRSGLQCHVDGRFAGCENVASLSNTSVFAFHEAPDGTMWIGTSKGLLRVRVGAPSARYTEAQGLADDVVFTILDDGAGGFWTSSNRGIARTAIADFDALDRGEIDRLRPRAYGKADGMRASQANGASQSPGVRTRDGRLFIATVRGAVMIDPARLGGNTLVPPVSVERVVVDGAPVDARGANRFGPGVDRLEFHYAAMSYVAPEAVRYRYRLDGYDREWVDAGARRTAYYTNLRPGDYTFRVAAANNDGVWNEQGARVAFAIEPRYYESPWFRALVALAAAAALAAAYRLRVQRLRTRERELTRLVGERTDELREANAALVRMASLDGLTRIANRATFDIALAQAWQEHRRRAAPLSVLICDIDAFKAYNDTYGHPAGDAALVRVAATIQSHARKPGHLAARYGGEEFAVLLADTPHDAAAAAAVALLEAVRALAIPHGTSPAAPRVTLSIGVASCLPDARLTVEQLVESADRALYRAKRAGRDRVASDPAAAAPAASREH